MRINHHRAVSKWVLASAVATGMLLNIIPAGAAPDAGTAASGVQTGSVIEPPIDCRPTATHPNPVIVLPGADGTTAQTDADMAALVTALRQQGACTLVFQGGIINGQRWAGDMPSSALGLATFVSEVQAATGAAKVDMVAHSAGTFVTNYFLKVLGGAPDVHDAVFLAPEARGCDGAGFLAQYGIKNLPVTPVQLLQAMPFLVPVLEKLLPTPSALQLTPGSAVYQAVMDGPLAQPGVQYSVMATKNDQIATPAGTCSFITEPGVTNVFYEDLFPDSPAVDHSTLRSSPQTASWVVGQLYSR